MFKVGPSEVLPIPRPASYWHQRTKQSSDWIFILLQTLRIYLQKAQCFLGKKKKKRQTELPVSMKNLEIEITNLKLVALRTFQIIWSLNSKKRMMLTTGAKNTPETIHMVKYMLFPLTVIQRVQKSYYDGRNKILKCNSNKQLFLGLYHQRPEVLSVPHDHLNKN